MWAPVPLGVTGLTAAVPEQFRRLDDLIFLEETAYVALRTLRELPFAFLVVFERLFTQSFTRLLL